MGGLLAPNPKLAVGVEGRKAECSFDLKERGTLPRSYPSPTTKPPFTHEQWPAPICKADVNLTPQRKDWRVVFVSGTMPCRKSSP